MVILAGRSLGAGPDLPREVLNDHLGVARLLSLAHCCHSSNATVLFSSFLCSCLTQTQLY